MKLIQLLVAIPMTILGILTSVGQTTDTLKFVDNFRDATIGQPRIATVAPKEMRLSSNAGKIEFSFDGNPPDSVQLAVKAAIDIWESKLKFRNPLYIHFKWDEVESGNDVETDVVYAASEKLPGKFYPQGLYKNCFIVDDMGVNAFDAIISFNKNKDWECGFSENAVGQRNITYAALRAIAQSLGFGASVTEKTTRRGTYITFGSMQGYSVFDYLVSSSSGVKLSDIANVGNRENPALTSFVSTPDGTEIYAQTATDSYKLYAPEKFVPYKSLVYLDKPDALMHYDLSEGDKILQIDDITEKLLAEIGWTFPSVPISIIGEGIDSTGIASAYEPHTFFLHNPDGNAISNPQWTFTLPGIDGSEVVVCRGNDSASFSIPAITDEDSYDININGDIYGTVTFECDIDGEKTKATYRVSLELKPRLSKVSITGYKIYPPDGLFYDLSFTAEYYGCEFLTVYVEQENASTLLRQFIREPFFAHATASHIAVTNYAWVDIVAENKYGSDTYTIELPSYPNFGNIANESILSGIQFVERDVNKSYTHIDIYNLQGNKVTSIQQLSQLKTLPVGNIYILKYYCGDNCCRTTKYVAR